MPTITLRRSKEGSIVASGDLVWQGGHRFLREDGRTDGIYAGWTWDRDSLSLSRDAYGFYPLFAWTTADACVIADGLCDLLDSGASPELDHDALAVFVRLGFFLGNDTPFRAIRAVPPGAVLQWNGHGPRLIGRRRDMPPPSPISRDQAIDRYIDLFRSAVSTRVASDPYVLPLSGGRDSRHILLALVEAGRPPRECVTVEHRPPRGNDDAEVAAVLCRRLGIRHRVLPQPGLQLATEAEKNVRTHFCSDEHGQFVVLANYLGAATTVTYDGIAGDVLSQSSNLTPALDGLFTGRDEQAIARHLLDRSTSVSENALAALLAPPLFREWSRERAIARLCRELRHHVGVANPVSAFFFWNRTRREIALSPFALMRDITVHAPYLDRDVFHLLASLPASLHMDGRLHTDAIARGYPRYADVPYATGRPQAQGTVGGWRVAADLLRSVLTSRHMLRVPSLLPGLAATLVDGKTARLWHSSLTVYLGQLAALAARAR